MLEKQVSDRFYLVCFCLFSAIQSLDCLNDQIVQFIFNPIQNDAGDEKDLEPKEQETLHSSMVLIRKLLQDAQAKFRNMVEDNKQLAAKIDGSINAANQEVSALRAELEDTNKRLSELSDSEIGKLNNGHTSDESDSQCKFVFLFHSIHCISLFYCGFMS